MTVTDPTMSRRNEVRAEPNGTYTARRRETKLFAKTSEFWAMLIGVVAVAAVYLQARDASLDLWRASLLATSIGIAYIVSRGIAKAGSRDHRDVENTY